MMGFALVVSLTTVVFGAVCWAWFFRAQDRREPESWFDLTKLLLIGAGLLFYAGSVNSAVSEIFFPGVGPDALLSSSYAVSFFTIVRFLPFAAVEELLKAVMVWLFAYHKRGFNQIQDGVIYAAMVALGFSVMENLMYLMNFIATGSTQLVVVATLVRTVATTLLHVTASGFFGYAIARTKFFGRPAYWGVVWYGAGAIALHTVFNSLVGTGHLYTGFALTIVALAFLLRLMRKQESVLVWRPLWRRK